MGYTLDDTGKPAFSSTPTQTVADLQATVDYAEKVGGLLKLTSTERSGLTPSEVKPGWIISETDTGRLYLVTASEPLGVPLLAGAYQPAGSAPGAGVTMPSSGFSLGGLIIKTGRMRSSTAVSFGNEYMPLITFDDPFPNAVLTVQVTPFNISGGPQAPDRPFAVDTLSPTGFRMMIPSSGSSTDRAFTWMAVGY